MAIRDPLLRKQLQESTVQTGEDAHETAKAYTRWVPGVRSLLRLRYLDAKKQVLIENKQALRYDVDNAEIHQRVLTNLNQRRSLWPTLLKPLITIPLIIALLAAAAYLLWRQHQSSLDRALFRNDIPAYSDAVYQLKASNAALENQKSPEILDKIKTRLQQQETELAELEHRIIEHFSEVPAVPEKLSNLFNAIQEKDLAPQDLYALVKQLNDELFINRIPYYLSPMVETSDCSFLPLSKFLERLFGGAQGTGDTCTVYALLSFHVDEFRYYNAEQQNHLAFFTRRLDAIPLNENVLGKVHLGDDSAQILLSNIDASSASSTIAVNDGQLQTKLMPQGMPDVYGLESIARSLQTQVVDQYADELRQSWQWTFERVWHRLTGVDSNILPAATEKLQRRVADVTAFHEVQHLIDQFNDLQEPSWFQDTLKKVATNAPMSEQFSSHVLWELSAFFTHLAYGEELKGVLLNEFTGITLNPLLQDQPHYYSIRILLPILHEMHRGTLGQTPPDPALTLSDVARSYKYLAQHVDSLDAVAKDAYKQLFGTELPGIVQTDLRKRKISEAIN